MTKKSLSLTLEPEINWKFLNQPVEVTADVFTIKGRLLKVARSIESHGAMGDVLLENGGRRMLVVGRTVAAIRRRKEE